jgi:site-specific DNA-methyltransferase (adenine-specific)
MLPEPFYNEDGITLYCCDCRDILPHLPQVDLVLTDPPYGIGWKPRVNHQDQPWIDNKQFDPGPFLDFGTEHVFWGANYFSRLLPHSPDWLTWVKRPIHYDFSSDTRSYSTVELAWTNLRCGARFKAHTWDGGLRAGVSDNRTFCHPSQKPIELMVWCLEFSRTSGTILDPFAGSGTTLVAAKQLGRRAIGIEIEPRYCAIAVERLRQQVLPLEPLPPAPEQIDLLGGAA